MNMYLIRETYVEGPHAGNTYLLIKGGYIVDDKTKIFCESDCYSLPSAKRVCTNLLKNNEFNRQFERKQESYDVSKGKAPKKYYLYYNTTYEPVEVSVYDDRKISY